MTEQDSSRDVKSLERRLRLVNLLATTAGATVDVFVDTLLSNENYHLKGEIATHHIDGDREALVINCGPHIRYPHQDYSSSTAVHGPYPRGNRTCSRCITRGNPYI